MMTIGLVGAGHMGTALGAMLREGGHDVVTTLVGRSARTHAFVTKNGIRTVAGLDGVVAAAGVVLVVTPPGAALDAATDIVAAARAAGARPLIVDLNAVSPSTMERIEAVLAGGGLELVDGSISGPPPTVRAGAHIYLSGPRAGEVAGLEWRNVRPVMVGDAVGMASAVKMCTASVYKGLVALFAQAMRTAAHHGVLDLVIADLQTDGHSPASAVAVAATKAERFVPEMIEIAQTQAGAGLPASLFEAFATVYGELARGDLARQEPESVDRNLAPAAVVAGLVE